MTTKEFTLEFFRETTGAEYADVEFVVELLNNFNLSLSDIGWDYLIELNMLSTNEIISEIYAVILFKYDLKQFKYDYYVNALDSHLYINSQEVYTVHDIERIKNPHDYF